MSDAGDMVAKRAKWQSYFEQRLIGGAAEVNAATEGAMQAIARREDVDSVIAAGLAAAKYFRSHATMPPAPQQARKAAPPPRAQQPTEPRARAQATTAPSYSPSPAPARSTSTVSSSSGGVVSSLQQRQEMVGRTYFTVWNFRLENPDGSRSTPISVEMRGRYFHGAIANGDQVDIGHRVRPGKLVKAQRVRNVTTGTDVKAVGKPHRVAKGFFITIFMIVFLAIFLFVAVNILNVMSNF